MKRSHYCNLRAVEGHLAQDGADQVILNGWIKKIRRHGAISFINLRDRYGEVQITIDSGSNASMSSQIENQAEQLRLEFCIAVRGTLQLRPENMQNKEIETGKYEVIVQELAVLNSCETLPFMPHKEKQEESDASEALRLKYRYLDLRSDGMQKRMILRHRLKHQIHSFLHERNFLEIETPTLIRSMPEGARDYLVPSRIHSGKFYALPQSPQLYKQLLMVGGLDRYYQIARCYRDEDARGDRQPEFTQLDIEMSFIQGKDVQELMEELMAQIWQHLFEQDLPRPFVRLSYDEAMNRYGSDKPDLRNPLVLEDFAEFAQKSDFAVFTQALQNNGCVKVLRVAASSEYCTRKIIAQLEEEAKKYGAKGLAWTRVTQQFDGGIGRFFQDQFAVISERYALESGDMLFFVADRWDTCCESLGAVRKRIAEDLGSIDKDAFAFAWIVDFPLFLPTDKEDNDAGTTNTGWAAAHHMFCMPHEEYLDKLEQNPGAARGEVYDLVLNGCELGSGSLRIHRAEIQERIFSIVGYPKEVAEQRFGFLLEALRYGAPPHGGIALGLDRLAMLMAHKESIKEVIAFPKNNLGQSLMDLSPAAVSPKQLEELKIVQLEKPDSSSPSNSADLAKSSSSSGSGSATESSKKSKNETR